MSRAERTPLLASIERSLALVGRSCELLQQSAAVQALMERRRSRPNLSETVRIPRALLTGRKYTRADVQVYVTLRDLGGRDGSWTGPQAEIGQRSGHQPRTVVRSLAALADGGFIRVIPNIDGHVNHYRILRPESARESEEPASFLAQTPAISGLTPNLACDWRFAA